MEEKQAAIKTGVLVLASAAAAYLLVKYLLPWLAPFAAAFFLAALMEPGVRWLCRNGWSRGFASGAVTILLFAALAALFVWLAGRAAAALAALAAGLPDFMEKVETTLDGLRTRASAFMAGRAESQYLTAAMDSIAGLIYTLPEEASRWALGRAARAAGQSPGIALFAVTCGIGTYFTSAAMPEVKKFVLAQLPEKTAKKLSGMGRGLFGTLGGWMKAQLIMAAITFGELLAALALLRVQNAAGAAAVVALVDALPVFGAGIVLVPWGCYALLSGNVPLGVGLVVTSAVVSLVRSCIQAKLLGDQIGLHPLVSLIAMYVGWRVWGVWGMLLLPIAAVTVKQLNDNGIVRLWKPAA